MSSLTATVSRIEDAKNARTIYRKAPLHVPVSLRVMHSHWAVEPLFNPALLWSPQLPLQFVLAPRRSSYRPAYCSDRDAEHPGTLGLALAPVQEGFKPGQGPPVQ